MKTNSWFRVEAVLFGAAITIGTAPLRAADRFDVTILQAPAGATGFDVGGYDAVSATGYVVGRANVGPGFETRAVWWNADGTAAFLTDPDGMPATEGGARGVDSAGNVVGYVRPNDSADYVGVRWNANGVVSTVPQHNSIDLVSDSGYALARRFAAPESLTRLNPGGTSTLLGGANLGASAVAENGTVAGTAYSFSGSRDTAYRWNVNGSAAALDKFVGATSLRHTRGNGVNDAGVVVGSAELLSVSELRAVRWNTADQASFLPMPEPLQSAGGQALSIDNDGRILGAGAVAPGSGTGRRVVLWDAAGTPRLVQNLLTESGWSIDFDYGFASNDYSTSILVQGKHPTLTNNQYKYLLLQQVLSASVAAGTSARAAAGGGAEAVGGATVKFATVTGGTFAVAYDATTDASDLPALPAGLTLGADGDTQSWDVSLTGGTFAGEAKLTFGYDATDLPSDDLDALRVLHLLDNGQWETLMPTFGPDDTLTVTVSEFSPFVLAAVAVPEPGALALLTLASTAVLRRRRAPLSR
jgi:hypothetical protein